MPRILVSTLWISILALALAQLDFGAGAGKRRTINPTPTRPQVKVNMLNVCSPSAEEQKEIASALARVPKQPLFGNDFEVSPRALDC